MAEMNFKTSEVPTEAPLVGDFKCVVAASSMKENKAKTGSYLNLEMEVIDGEFAGRKFWSMFNIEHADETVRGYAMRDLKALCLAVGIEELNDSIQLHDLPFAVTLVLDKNDNTRSQARKYRPANDGANPAKVAGAHARPVTAPVAKTAGTGTAPWQEAAARRKAALNA